MEKEKNIKTIQQLYADVGAKNLDGVLNSLADDIKWEPPFTPGNSAYQIAKRKK